MKIKTLILLVFINHFCFSQIQFKVSFGLSMRRAFALNTNKDAIVKFSVANFAWPITLGAIAKIKEAYLIDINYSPTFFKFKLLDHNARMFRRSNYFYGYFFAHQFNSNFYIKLKKKNKNYYNQNQSYFTIGPSLTLFNTLGGYGGGNSGSAGMTQGYIAIKSNEEILPEFNIGISSKFGIQTGINQVKKVSSKRYVQYAFQVFLMFGKFPLMGRKIEFYDGTKIETLLQPRLAGINFSVWFIPKNKNIFKQTDYLE